MSDAILALAEAVYADYETTERARIRGQHQAGALVGLGFEAWVMPGDSYLDPDSHRRAQKILHNLAGKPYARELNRIGLLGHAQRDVERKVDWLAPYAEITRAGEILWGLRATRGRDALFEAKYDVVELVVRNGSDVVAKLQAASFDNSTTLDLLALDDDDYRFQVGARNTDWGYSGRWFDWAVVDGEWTDIGFQGHDWDGEAEGSTRRHTGETRIGETSARERAAAYFRQQREAREAGWSPERRAAVAKLRAEQAAARAAREPAPPPPPDARTEAERAADREALAERKRREAEQAEERRLALSDGTKAWVESRARRYGESGTGKHWREIAAAIA